MGDQFEVYRTKLKIVGHKSEKMHKRYNSVSETNLRQAAKRLDSYHSNTVITPAESSHQAFSISA